MQPAERLDPAKMGAQMKDCKATVVVAGAVEMDWTGKGTARTDTAGDGPKAVYRTQSGESSVTVYTQGGGFTPSVNFATAGTTFSTSPDQAKRIDATTKGTGASVRVTAASAAGQVAEVSADFVCGKSAER